DVVINQMASNSGTGTGGSSYDSGSQSYSGVPYGSNDFNTCDKCGTSSCNIEDYQNADQVRNCRLVGMNDLDQSTDYVREKMRDYLNHLIALGVAGFRIDAAKHMWPDDLSAIIDNLNELNTNFFPSGSKAFVYQEVIDLGGEPITTAMYLGVGRTLQFKYPNFLGNVFRNRNPMKYLVNFGEEWGMDNGMDAVVFICNHDDQRGQGGGGFDT